MEQLSYKYFQDEKEEKSSNKIFYKFVVILFLVYAIIFGIVFAYRSNFQYVTINGRSMQPTLNPDPVLNEEGEEVQDGVYIKLTHDVDYGDIIVIKRENLPSIIKRALAFGGDYITIASIEYDEGNDYRFMRVKQNSNNVEILNEKDYILSYSYWNSIESTAEGNVNYESVFYAHYSNSNYQSRTFTLNLDGQERDVRFFKVPENEIFFMGDNRTGSSDARAGGTRKISSVEGYVVKVLENGSFIKEDATKWFFQQICDFFEIIWREISIFFGAKA